MAAATVMRQHRRVPCRAQSDGRCELPPTEQLLVEGGDARIVLDARRAINQYGCPALPDPELLAFGSSTASVISAQGFAAAERLRTRLQQAIATESAERVYARELERVRQELRHLCGLEAPAEPDIVFATSGTDLHLIAAQLVAGGAPTLAIMIEAAETGSQVLAALNGRHFGTCFAAQGSATAENGAIGVAAPIEVASVAVRLDDGSPRPTAEVDAEVESLVAQAIALAQRVLLIVVDVAKTGLLAPSPACALRLKQHHAGQIEVLVDACQWRLAPATLRAYLAQDFMVALTGSKFMTGPTFSGALLLPPALAARLRPRPLPAALWPYSTRAEWPAGWEVADLAAYANFGLLLRWEAALTEMRAFHALPEIAVARVLAAFARAVAARLAADPWLVPLPVPVLDRLPLIAGGRWDDLQTIFPFLLRAAPGGRFLSAAETSALYQALLQCADGGVRCQFGQPVACGQRDGQTVSALRLCASARLVVEAAHSEAACAAVIARAMQALDRATKLAQSLTRA